MRIYIIWEKPGGDRRRRSVKRNVPVYNREEADTQDIP